MTNGSTSASSGQLPPDTSDEDYAVGIGDGGYGRDQLASGDSASPWRLRTSSRMRKSTFS